MVNKAVVGVIGVVLITTLGVGALVGLQGGGGPAEDGTPNDDANGNSGTAATATPNGSMGNGTIAPPNATATDDPGEDLSLTRSEFTRNELERNVTRALNEWRANESLEPLETGPGTTKEALKVMAREHSARMADAEVVAHDIENDTTKNRYEAHDLYHACSFKPPDKQYTALPGAPDVQQFEWIAGHEVDTTFSRDRGILFHENETAVARTIVDQWRSDNATEYGLLSPNYGKAGIGVNVTQDGTVYATVHLCGK